MEKEKSKKKHKNKIKSDKSDEPKQNDDKIGGHKNPFTHTGIDLL